MNCRSRVIIAIAAAALLAATAPSGAQTGVQTGAQIGLGGKRVPASGGEVQLSFAPLVKKAAPAVVNIYARKVVRRQGGVPLFDDPLFRRFFGSEFDFGMPREQIENSLGSGVIIRANGLIVTNRHVIKGADQINVVLSDRREFAAKVVVSDDRTDLAILQVDSGGEALPVLELRDSDDLEVGDLVLAIGNPFGVGQTVTSGIVSALARTQVTASNLNFFIQTDAAINPGGALVGMDGKLVGVNTAIFTKSGGSQGIGFAIPSNMVRAVITGIAKDGRLVRPWLGASGQAVSQDVATSLGLARPTGVLISHIHKGAAAALAGLKVGDVVLAVNGHEVNDPQALRYRIATLPVGEQAALRVWRRNSTLALQLTLAPPPETPPRDVTRLKGHQPLAGAVVANMSPALGDEIGLDPFVTGVIVLELERGSPARRLGFRTGDLIRVVNGVTITGASQLRALVNQQAPRWKIGIERDGQRLSLTING